MSGENEPCRPLLVRYKIPKLSLYELTYLSEYLLELVVLGHIIDPEQDDFFPEMLWDDLLEPSGRPRSGLSQLAVEGFCLRHPDALNVKRLNVGSLEIELANSIPTVSLLVTTVLGYTTYRFQRHKMRPEEKVINVESDDEYIHQLVSKVEKGDFGKFDKAFPLLRDVLRYKGYHLEAESDKLYRVLKANAMRTESIIRTAYRIRG